MKPPDPNELRRLRGSNTPDIHTILELLIETIEYQQDIDKRLREKP